MKLFKNEVGRPSNETLKKRRMVIIGIIAAAALLVGGVTFALVKAFKPVEGVGHNAQANKFVVVKNSDTCYTVYAPSNAKNWAAHVYYKNSSDKYFGSKKIASLSKYHDNDGVKQQKICFTKQAYENETFRILVKWTQGKNHKTYGKVSNWKPDKYTANNAIGWAYKDYEVSWSGSTTNNSSSTNNGTTNNSSSTVKPALTITEPKTHTYRQKTIISIKFKHNQNKTMYYTFQNYNKGIAGYKQKCTAIKAGETKSFTLDVKSDAPMRHSTITLYSDSKCSNLVDTRSTSVFYYDPMKLVLTQPSQKVYNSNVKVTINFKIDSTYNTRYYKFVNYNLEGGTYKAGYTRGCTPIQVGETKSFTLDVNKNYPSRKSTIELYSDYKCKNKVDSKTTDTYAFITDSDVASALTIDAPKQTCYTDPKTLTVYYKNNLGAKVYAKWITYGSSGKFNATEHKIKSWCGAINSKETKKFTLDLRRTGDVFYQRSATVALYYDSECENMITAPDITSQQSVGTYSLKDKC